MIYAEDEEILNIMGKCGANQYFEHIHEQGNELYHTSVENYTHHDNTIIFNND